VIGLLFRADERPQTLPRDGNQKAFAAGAKRENIMFCEEKLGIKLPDFIEIALSAMQKIHSDLGL